MPNSLRQQEGMGGVVLVAVDGGRGTRCAARRGRPQAGRSRTPKCFAVRNCARMIRAAFLGLPPARQRFVTCRMIDRAKARALLGETVREIGVLLIVFVPVDAFFQGMSVAPFPLVAVVFCALVCIVLGIMVEAQARRVT
jgi:hypothetical protein